ncbi:hypothetical protein AKJ16_DCAP20782 [Drosera capensis]
MDKYTLSGSSLCSSLKTASHLLVPPFGVFLCFDAVKTDQMVDSTTLAEAVSRNGESESSLHDKQPPVSVMKTPLRDLPYVNNMAEQKYSMTNLSSKEEDAAAGGVKVFSTKRPPPESPMNPLQSTSAGNANGRLVYVRRKLDAEVVKNNTNDNNIVHHKADDNQPGQLGPQEDANQQRVGAVEAKEQSSPASAPIPTTITTTLSSGEPSGPTNFEAPNNTTVPSSDQKKVINRNWEERYLQLQIYLKKLDQINLDDHLRELRSFSSAELSSYAVELEKRAIHLSLVEGKEIQRVRALNVLGKAFKIPEPPPAITKMS